MPSLPVCAPDWLDQMPTDIQALYRYWDEKRGTKSMPARADIDPLDLKAFLPGILLVDVVPDERLYVYRLVGTREVQLRGCDPTGLPVQENSFDEDPANALRYYDQAVLSKHPCIETTPLLSADRMMMSLEAIYLPLSDDGEEVNKILVFAAHKWVDLPPM